MQIPLDKKRLDITFGICTLFMLLTPALWPQLRLVFFAPFLVIVCYQKPLKTCLWLGIFCGILLDLLSSQNRFGLHSLDFCLTLIFIYPLRRNFFADNISTLPIMTYFFSVTSTLIMAIILYSVEMKSMLSVSWILADMLFMPLIDAFYAFSLFILPPLILGNRLRPGKDYFH